MNGIETGVVTAMDSAPKSIETQVLAKLGSRLREFCLDVVGGQVVLHGKASSYHVKQLAQHQVMGLTDQPIHSNQIEVTS